MLCEGGNLYSTDSTERHYYLKVPNMHAACWALCHVRGRLEILNSQLKVPNMHAACWALCYSLQQHLCNLRGRVVQHRRH